MLVSSGSFALATDAVTATVTGTWVLPYQVSVTPSWMTDYFIDPASKTTTQFVVTFGFEAPAGATIDYIVSQPDAVTPGAAVATAGHGSNRLTRDEILLRALDLIDSPSLDQKARPMGAIDQQAFIIGWLQDGLDFFHRKFPWTGLIQTQALTLSGAASYTLPADFVLDLRDGLRIPSENRRCQRHSLSWLLSRDMTSAKTGLPEGYVIQPPNIRVYPWPDQSYPAELWYYSLPAALTAAVIPNFPDDWTLVEFVRLRGKEWTGESEPGTALAFAATLCADLQKSGLGNEADTDALTLDQSFFRPTGSVSYDRNAWMGTR